MRPAAAVTKRLSTLRSESMSAQNENRWRRRFDASCVRNCRGPRDAEPAGSSQGRDVNVRTKIEESAESKGWRRKRSSPRTVCRRLCVRSVAVPSFRGKTSGRCFRRSFCRWSAHPVLSKPVMLRGAIPTDGSPGRGNPFVGRPVEAAGGHGRREGTRRAMAAFEDARVHQVMPCAQFRQLFQLTRKAQ